MTTFESIVCNMAEGHNSGEIESLISELQMIADRKYQEEEDSNYEIFPGTLSSLNNLKI